jgi:hypothetical protein
MTPEEFYANQGSPWGESPGYDGFHTGQDYPWGAGTPVPSPGAGTVAEAGVTSIHGNYVTVFYPSVNLYLQYCHLISPGLSSGPVSKGTIVGNVGESGTGAEGYHLHLAASDATTPGFGNRQDPVPVVTALLQNTPLNPSDEGDEYVTIYFATGAAYDVVQSGWKYLQGPDGILRAFSSLAWQAYVYTHPSVIVAPWNCVDIYNHLVVNYGLYEYEGTTEPGRLTGRIIQGQNRFYPRVAIA